MYASMLASNCARASFAVSAVYVPETRSVRRLLGEKISSTVESCRPAWLVSVAGRLTVIRTSYVRILPPSVGSPALRISGSAENPVLTPVVGSKSYITEDPCVIFSRCRGSRNASSTASISVAYAASDATVVTNVNSNISWR